MFCSLSGLWTHVLVLGLDPSSCLLPGRIFWSLAWSHVLVSSLELLSGLLPGAMFWSPPWSYVLVSGLMPSVYKLAEVTLL